MFFSLTRSTKDQFREVTGMAELLVAGVQTPPAHSADVIRAEHRSCSLNPLQHGYRQELWWG